MRKIDHPESYDVYEFDNSVCVSTVYTGTLRNLENANNKLKWREETALGQTDNVLTLDEIRSQLKNQYGGKEPFITVFVESPLHGEIYQYDNYGDSWYQIGEVSGYA